MCSAAQIITQSRLPSCAMSWTASEDLFIHVNPILNGWLQSSAFTLWDEVLLLRSRQPVFLFWDAEWGEFNLYENAHHQVWGAFFLIIHPSALKGTKALWCSFLFNIRSPHQKPMKCMLTTTWQSTWKCLFRPVSSSIKRYSHVMWFWLWQFLNSVTK